jgi:ABC-2 type transport system ATP-binding protein
MVIHLKGLTKKYSQDVFGIKHIDLNIEEGMFGLLGPNGAGKTTLQRILATLIQPSAGEANIGYLNVKKDKMEIRRILGYLPQHFGVYPELTAYEFLDYLGLLYGMEDKKRKYAVSESLEKVHLIDLKDRKLKSFSGGMIRRIGIAQAILNDPKLLLVDEPTSGLDPEERVRFRNLLSDMSDGKIIIISTHIAHDIASCCTTMAILDHGEIKFHGSPQLLLKAAQGRIYEIKIHSSRWKEIKHQYKIISTRRERNEITLRVASRENVHHGTKMNPNLEDAYMFCMMES